jgi:contactin associated protein-like 2
LPEISETRPPPTLAPGETLPTIPQSASTGAIVGGVIAAIIVIIILGLFASGRFVSRQKGDYVTHEDKGAQHALDPDTAVVKGKTGPDVTKKKEYFI